MKEKILFTSESVSEGHPDKVCDQIADAILDECLKADPSSHVACEVFATTDYVLIGGEITCKNHPDYEKIAREVILSIGYDSPEKGLDGNSCKIDVKIKEQSPDINQGVSRGDPLEQGAGDQGMMFGYASNETKGYMPLPISIAHKLVRTATSLRKKGLFPGARPDMKAQVTIDYTDPKNIKIFHVLMSIQHDPDVDLPSFRKFIHEEIMVKVIESFGLATDFRYDVNPTGRFVLGGPAGDSGLTGRKIIVDTYGGSARHGGGSFSGKDPSKVDRSGAMYARYIAKNLVAAGVSDRLEVQLSYGIGIAEPIAIWVNTYGTGKYDEKTILEAIHAFFDARPGAINQQFSLTKPSFKYRDIANYGAFGRNDLGDLPWERLDKVELIKAFLATKK